MPGAAADRAFAANPRTLATTRKSKRPICPARRKPKSAPGPSGADQPGSRVSSAAPRDACCSAPIRQQAGSTRSGAKPLPGVRIPITGPWKTRARHVAFVIASAAAGLDPASVELYSVGNSVNLKGLAGAERDDALAYLHALVGVAYRGESRQALEALALQFKPRDWYVDLPPADNYYWAFSRALRASDPRRIGRASKRRCCWSMVHAMSACRHATAPPPSRHRCTPAATTT